MICDKCAKSFIEYIKQLYTPDGMDTSFQPIIKHGTKEDLQKFPWLHCHCDERSMPELMGFEPYVDPDRKKD